MSGSEEQPPGTEPERRQVQGNQNPSSRDSARVTVTEQDAGRPSIDTLLEQLRENDKRVERAQRAWANREAARLERAPGSALCRLLQCVDTILAHWTGRPVHLKSCAQRIARLVPAEDPREDVAVAVNRLVVSLEGQWWLASSLRKRLVEIREELATLLKEREPRTGERDARRASQRAEELQERLAKAMVYLADNPDATQKEVASFVGCSASALSRLLKKRGLSWRAVVTRGRSPAPGFLRRVDADSSISIEAITPDDDE